MSIDNARQLENTKRKLKQLEQRLAELATKPTDNPALREATRHSLRKLANQLREEITRFKVHMSADARNSPD